MPDQIFIREGNQLHPQDPRSFEQGIDGTQLEYALQKLIAYQTGILPGVEIDPTSPEPPRFALLGIEVAIAGWSLDLLLVDQKGIPTLIETKLLRNREARRNVIGQILDYAANARETWLGGKLRTQAVEFWQKKHGKDLDEHLGEVFAVQEEEGAFQPDEFWQMVEENVKNGHLRLMVVADELHPDARRILEYLNEEMQNVQVLGLEVRCFGPEERLIIVPHLIGQTQKRKSVNPPRSTGLWGPEQLREAFEKSNDQETGQRLKEVLEWALEKNFFLEAVSKYPGFSLRSKTEARLLTVYGDGNIVLFLNQNIYPTSTDRWQFISALNSIGLYHLHESEIAGRNSKVSDKKISALNETELEHFLHALEMVCSPAA